MSSSGHTDQLNVNFKIASSTIKLVQTLAMIHYQEKSFYELCLQIEILKSLTKIEKKELLAMLSSIEETFKLVWADHGAFVSLQERILSLRMILEEPSNKTFSGNELSQIGAGDDIALCLLGYTQMQNSIYNGK